MVQCRRDTEVIRQQIDQAAGMSTSGQGAKEVDKFRNGRRLEWRRPGVQEELC